VFFLSNFLIKINPTNKEMYIIRILSIIVISFILYYNSVQSNLLSSFIIPLSVTKITFLNDFLNDDENNPLEIFYIRNPMIT